MIESLKDAMGIIDPPAESHPLPSAASASGDTHTTAQIRARRAKRAMLRGCNRAKKGRLKRKYAGAVRYVGTVGEKTIMAGGRTKREAERRLRKAFREAGVSSQPSPLTDLLEMAELGEKRNVGVSVKKAVLPNASAEGKPAARKKAQKAQKAQKKGAP